MSQNDVGTLTYHAMLVIWGQFAHCLGVPSAFQAVKLHQKTVQHSPQTKVLEFLVSILAGLEHMQDISRSAHPLDQDLAVAKAWGQPGWADYSGVSRTLSGLTQAEADQIAALLEQIGRPILAEETMQALQAFGRLSYDGDLTDRPVSNTSTTYPGVAYGHMGDGVRLGYQAAMVSMHSPTYGRFWLSVEQHPDDTISCTQAEAMVRAAEAKTGLRPWRRTDLLDQRIRTLENERQKCQEQEMVSQSALEKAEARLADTQQELPEARQAFLQHETEYEKRQRRERPYSALAKARQRVKMLERRQERRAQQILVLEKRLQHRQQQVFALQAQIQRLNNRQETFDAENRTNACPIQADFRLDAGFGTRENIAFLIEMGYEVYTKPYSDWLTPRLKRRECALSNWMRVGDNAEMLAWKNERFPDFPYPVDVALERFHTGKTIRHSTLLHFGSEPVTTDLPSWFHRYNARQTIEAGIKEGKNVFTMHHLKVRAAPAIFLQEQFAVFAANFVRWAARWLAEQCPQIPAAWQDAAHPKVKEMVRVAAHTSAWVDWQDQGCFFKVHGSQPVCRSIPFGEKTMGCSTPVALFRKCTFLTFLALCALIAQNLR
jgi:hypothetical protein